MKRNVVSSCCTVQPVDKRKKKAQPTDFPDFMPTDGPEMKRRSLLSKIFHRHKDVKFEPVAQVGEDSNRQTAACIIMDNRLELNQVCICAYFTAEQSFVRCNQQSHCNSPLLPTLSRLHLMDQ